MQKPEDPSSVPKMHVESLGVAVYACNSSVGEADTGGSLGLTGQLHQTGNSRANMRPRLKNLYGS